MKLTISFLLATFACANLAAKCSDVNLSKFLNSNIFIMIMISRNFLFNFITFYVIVSFFTKLLTLSILFSATVRYVVVAKLVIFGILFLISFILALRLKLALTKIKINF